MALIILDPAFIPEGQGFFDVATSWTFFIEGEDIPKF